VNEILLDTDVVSYLLNRHQLASAYEKLLIDRTPMISFMTIAEMYRGALKKNWGERRVAELDSHLQQFAIVPFSLQVCKAFAHICNSAERKGKRIDTADALIAACAVSLQIPLLTNNKRHFEGIEELIVISA
jgi:predicted nucleic acid-binding protein